jgi:hypothetical protein
MAESNGASLQDAEAELKEFYSNQGPDYAVARNNPFFAMIEKDTALSGKVYVQPIAIGGSQDYVDFSVAQTNQVPVNNLAFQVPTNLHYALATVQNDSIKASRNDRGAFIGTLKQAVDIAMQNSILMDAWYLFRSGTGSIGTVSGAPSTGLITLSNPSDALAFQRGQVLTATSTDGGGTTRAGIGYVLAVSISTGQILVSDVGQGGAAGNPSGWADGDYLYPQSNLNAQMNGLSGWLPTSTSTLRPAIGTAKNFLGVDRSIDPTRLAGTSLDLRGEDMESALIDLISQVKSIGRGKPDYTMVNPISYRALTKALQARRSYVDASVTSEAGITFRGCMVEDSLVLQDPSCPAKTAFALDMSTWKLISMGPNPDFIEYPDGLGAFRVVTGSDAVEARIGGYRNVVCSDPAKNGVALLPQ